ncbi:MAG: ATP-binding protein [Candidatus Margulisbacteria bacterium]|nr:ATP-binding protein [Candidatus Margulisiibacteriota bacterium]
MKIGAKHRQTFWQNHPSMDSARKLIIDKGRYAHDVAKTHIALHRAITNLPAEQLTEVRDFIADKGMIHSIVARGGAKGYLWAGLMFAETGHYAAMILQGLMGFSNALAKPKENQDILNEYPTEKIGKIMHDLVLNNLSVFDAIKDALLSVNPLHQTDCCELNQLLNKSLSSYKTIFSNMEIQLCCATKKINISLDQKRFNAALFNLILNSNQHYATRAEISIKRSKNEVVIKIIDNGEGFDQKTKDHITEPGFTTAKKGYRGFGTTISKRIIEDHGGTFDIDSPGVGKGCRVAITLPLAL